MSSYKKLYEDQVNEEQVNEVGAIAGGVIAGIGYGVGRHIARKQKDKQARSRASKKGWETRKARGWHPKRKTRSKSKKESIIEASQVPVPTNRSWGLWGAAAMDYDLRYSELSEVWDGVVLLLVSKTGANIEDMAEFLQTPSGRYLIDSSSMYTNDNPSPRELVKAVGVAWDKTPSFAAEFKKWLKYQPEPGDEISELDYM